MDELRTQQIEALGVASEYCGKIITALNRIIEEYTGTKLEDTEEYQKGIVNGLNWIIEVYNGTQDLIKENGTNIDKALINQYVQELNIANESNDDLKKADALKGLLSFVTDFREIADKILSA